ncbi:MAG: hypothetical protein ABSG43_27470 [Solirubrobacteraceae bacterium]
MLDTAGSAPSEASATRTWRHRESVMLAEHEQRFPRIIGDYLERPAGECGELLHRGQG